VPDVSRLARAEVLAERRARVLRDPGPDEVCGEMRAPGGFSVRDLQHGAEHVRESCRFQASCYQAGPLLPRSLLPLDAAAQGRARGVDVEADNVDAVAAPGGREFDAGDQAGTGHRGVDAVECRERVVIGDRERVDAAFMGMDEQGVGIERAVGSVAVGVQVEDHVAGIIRGRRWQQSRAADM
jgi:hypothetical protein